MLTLQLTLNLKIKIFTFQSQNRMYPSFILIRHGQSIHNEKAKQIYQANNKNPNFKSTPQYKVLKLNESMCDGNITNLGVSQASKLRQSIKLDDIDVVVVSPLRRALQTCDIVFKDKLQTIKVYVQPLMTELLTSAVDVGSKIKQSKQIYGKKFDFSKIDQKNQENWYLNILTNQSIKKQIIETSQKQHISIQSSTVKLMKDGPLQSNVQLKKRVEKLKEELVQYKHKSKKKIALLGHAYLFRYLTATGFYEDDEPINAISLENCEAKQTPIIIEGFFQQEEDIVPFCKIP